MGRGRIPMELIQKEKARKATFTKRKKGLMKKVYEFSTLCGVDVGVILYAPAFLNEPETWPAQDKDPDEIKRVIKKYHDTTADRRPKVYDVHEYFNDRTKKIEGEVQKVQKEKIKLTYPTWDDSYNSLGEEQLRMFVGVLDSKLDACNQRMNMLKRDNITKGKGIDHSYVGNSHVSFMQNMCHTQLFQPSDHSNQVASFYPYHQFGQSSQLPSSMFHFGQSCIEKNAMVDWANNNNNNNQVGGAEKMGADHKNQNSSTCYYNNNGNMQTTMQPYTVGNLQSLPHPSQFQYDATFQSLPDQPGQPPGFGINGFYDSNMLQPQFFNCMHGRK